MTDQNEVRVGRPTATGRGPHAGYLAIVTLALTLAAVAVAVPRGAVAAAPLVDAAQLLSHYQADPFGTRLSAFLEFGAAVPLGILAATLFAQLRGLGLKVPGPAIGFVGGVLASVVLALSALVSWVLSIPDVLVDAATVKALASLSFVLGAEAYAVGIGLLVAGVAVPALFLRLTPRWFAWTGLVIAALAELAFFALLLDPLQFLIPIGRFGGGLWLIAAGFLLPRTARRAS